jgi:hypothetical protein
MKALRDTLDGAETYLVKRGAIKTDIFPKNAAPLLAP